MDNEVKATGEIEVPVWWRSGGMLYNRDCLPVDHPEQTYNYIKYNLGVDPEDFGVTKPKGYGITCPECGYHFEERS